MRYAFMLLLLIVGLAACTENKKPIPVNQLSIKQIDSIVASTDSNIDSLQNLEINNSREEKSYLIEEVMLKGSDVKIARVQQGNDSIFSDTKYYYSKNKLVYYLSHSKLMATKKEMKSIGYFSNGIMIQFKDENGVELKGGTYEHEIKSIQIRNKARYYTDVANQFVGHH